MPLKKRNSLAKAVRKIPPKVVPAKKGKGSFDKKAKRREKVRDEG